MRKIILFWLRHCETYRQNCENILYAIYKCTLSHYGRHRPRLAQFFCIGPDQFLIPFAMRTSQSYPLNSLRLCLKITFSLDAAPVHEPQRQKTYLLPCAPSEDSDQPAHSRSLIRIFTGHIWIARMQSFFMRATKTLIKLRGRVC